MREININIEGFNVNGICVGCLNYNRKMYYNNEIKECFKLIGEIDVPDGLSIQVCYECLAAVERVLRFQRMIVKSFDVLIKYSRQNTFLNSPSDLTQHATQTLVQTPVDEFSYICNAVREGEKIEIDISVVKDEDLDVKENEDNFDSEGPLKDEMKVEEQFTEHFLSLDDVQAGMEQTSEDDIQLSKLKKKKEKRSKKTKKHRLKKSRSKPTSAGDQSTLETKNSRKLKNLPEHLVELYTMSEEEMWQVRAEDLESEEFAKTKYKCRDCIIEFNTEKLMNDHMSGKHRPKSDDCDQCDVCRAYILTRDKLSAHRALHLSCYRCTACGRRTTLKRLMQAHARSHGGARDEYACATCGTTFTTKSKLSYHRASCEQERPQCDCCGKVFASKMTLKYHLNLKTPKEAKPKENLFIPCKGCNKVFTSKKSYRAHVVIHDGQTYPCPICGKLFQWKRNLARHTRNHRERDAGATHECRECGKSFSSRDCYNNHMRLSKRHVAEDAYAHQCRYCGKKFASKYCMVDHIDWDHLKKTKYHCKVCFKAFKTAKIMVAHVNNIHEGKRNAELEGAHLCEICGKSYKTVKRLKGHVWAMHTNRSTAKSFRCLLCPATFTWQTSIYKHVKMMHNQKRPKPTHAPRGAPPAKAPAYPPPYADGRLPQYEPGGVKSVTYVAHAAHSAQQPPGAAPAIV